MAGGVRETDPAKLAKTCEQFMQGCHTLYNPGGRLEGDMWLFELYHHLKDCADALKQKRDHRTRAP